MFWTAWESGSVPGHMMIRNLTSEESAVAWARMYPDDIVFEAELSVPGTTLNVDLMQVGLGQNIDLNLWTDEQAQKALEGRIIDGYVMKHVYMRDGFVYATAYAQGK